MLKTVFLGTPDTAVPFLDRLVQKSSLQGVITAADKPVGRGYHLTPPPVRQAAERHGLPVLQPEKLNNPLVMETLRKWGPVDLGVVVAYGKLIPPDVFSYPRCGMMNVHFSLLPQYRGAAPVQWALMRGDTETGVTLFRIEKGLDSGPIFLQARASIQPEDTSVALRARLVGLGLRLLDESLERFGKGDWPPTPQSGETVPAPSLRKEDGRLAWDRLMAEEAVNLIRGTYEWPGAYTFFNNHSLKIREAEIVTEKQGDPGRIVRVEKGRGFVIKCKQDGILALRVQPEGKKDMPAVDFWNGARLKVGDQFDS